MCSQNFASLAETHPTRTIATTGASSNKMTKTPDSCNTGRAQAVRTLRQCSQDIAQYSDPQCDEDYVKLIGILEKKARALDALNQYSQMSACLEKIVKLARSSLPSHNLSLPNALEGLAECRAIMGDRVAAVSLFKECLEVRELAGMLETHPSQTACLKRMGDLHRDQDSLDKALEIYLEVLSLRRSIAKPDAGKKEVAKLAEALHDVGTTYHLCGEFERAIPFLKDALELKEKIASTRSGKGGSRGEEVKDATTEESEKDDIVEEGQEEEEVFMEMMYGLASTYAKNAEYTLAQPIYTELIARRRNEDPPNYIKLAQALTNVGAMHMEAGNCALALPFQEEALDILRMVLPEAHPQIAQALGNLGEVYRRLEDHDRALKLFQASLAMQRARGAASAMGKDSLEGISPMSMAGILNNLALLYRAMDKYTQAEQQLEEAVAWVKRAVPSGHPYITSMEKSLSALRHEAKDKAAGTYDPTMYAETWGLHSKIVT